jgi:3',5'-cyclic AMP phosphodiesterase CpdA
VEPSTDSDVTVVFRFRDLVAKTIPEHQAIVQGSATKSCWWGWWKRPTEDARTEIWDHLEAQLKSKGEAIVGLFDSGDDDPATCFRLARVTELKRPPAGEHLRNWEPPQLEPDEQALVPEYYRTSVFSRAWLKIVEFRPPSPLFGRYSYAQPPPLPGIPETELARLADKKVIDSHELRAMDTTIWLLRPTKDGDSTDRFLASSLRFSKPFESLALRVTGDSILHISDLHFAAGEKRKEHVWDYTGEAKPSTLVDRLVKALHGQQIGAIVVSGDLTFCADPAEFEHAKSALNALAGALGLGPDNIVVVPGNHDVKFADEPKRKTKGADPAPKAAVAAEDAYRSFYRDLFRHSPNEHFAMARRFVFPSGLVVEVCGLNSNSLETSRGHLAGIGKVGDGAFETAKQELDWNPEHPSAAFRILALHHHLTLTDDLEEESEYEKGFGTAIDAMKTLREAAKNGVQLVLHGHRHRSFVWRSAVYELPEVAHERWSLGHVSILGAGSCGSKSVKNGNCFNIIRVQPGGVEVAIYRSLSRGNFARFQSWQAEFSLDSKRGLVMQDWKHSTELAST